jgi:UDP-glucose 4-epimerase
VQRVVLTGASGTLGRNFLELVGNRPDFRVLALLRPNARIAREWPSVQAQTIEGLDRSAMGVQIGKFQPTCIVHCAATGMEFPRTQWFDLIRFNVDVTISLCECAAAIPCHFIYVSTGLSYRSQGRRLHEDDPLDTQHPYGASKAAADLLVRSAAAEFKVPLTVLRPFSFTGLGDDRTRLFATLLRNAAERRPMPLSPGTQIRDHCSARDIALGIIAAIERPHVPEQAGSRVYNLGSGRLIALRDLIEELVAELGLDADLHFGAREMSRFEPQHLVADTSRAQRELEWKPSHNLAHAVWQLGRESFPHLVLKQPIESL